MARRQALLHDGSRIDVVLRGQGPAVLLPVRHTSFDRATAETMKAWGADPDLGPDLIEGLAVDHLVVAADYEGHRMAHPAPDTLTPDNLTADLLAIADAGGAGTFAYYGYSWLALAGLQLAVRTDRLTGLAMGGFPPVDGPYRAMMAVTAAAHAAAGGPEPEVAAEPGDWDAAGVQADPAQTAQFVTLYRHLQDFDDRSAQVGLTVPRLCFAGAEDNIVYGPRWGDVTVRIADPLRENQAVLEAAGWRVHLLPGLDHLGAMHAAVVLPVLVEWFAAAGRPS